MEHFFFYIGLSFLLTHEMDAIRLKEWSMFPLLSSLNDKNGSIVFIVAHIPIYLLLFLGLHSNPESVIKGMDIFFIIHVLLHILFLKHKHNQFKSPLSWAIISTTGLLGLLDLLIAF